MTIEKIKVQESSEEQEKKSEKQSKQKLPYEVVEDFYGPGSWKEMSKVLADRFGIENYK
jgi:hypothetical protein